VKKLIAISILALSVSAAFAGGPQGSKAKYNGGTLGLKQGQDVKLSVTGSAIVIYKGKDIVATVVPTQVSDITIGADVYKRGGADVALALASPLLFLASGHHNEEYIGFSWSDGTLKNSVVLKFNPEEYRGTLLALETVSGKAPVDTGAVNNR
jgi:hypothetical protein